MRPFSCLSAVGPTQEQGWLFSEGFSGCLSLLRVSATLWAMLPGVLKNWKFLILSASSCFFTVFYRSLASTSHAELDPDREKYVRVFCNIVRLNCKSENWAFQINSISDSCSGSMVHSWSIFGSFWYICRQYLMEFFCETFVKYAFGGSIQKRNVPRRMFPKAISAILLDLTYKKTIMLMWISCWKQRTWKRY